MHIRMNKFALLAPILIYALVACGDAPSVTDDHAHGEDTHAHDDESVLIYTHYTELTELFVEFPPLVVGQASRFAAHVTTLSDYRPLTSGIVDVVLEQNGATVARFRVRQPTRDGLFTPTATPRDAGDFDLALEVSGDFGTARHDLGEITVFSSPEEVHTDQLPPEGDIVYLKEQQWAGQFATELATVRDMRESWPGFGTISAPPGKSAIISAPTDATVAVQNLVSPGATVAAGQVMARLIPRSAMSGDINALTTTLVQQQSRGSLAQAELNRVRELVESGALPRRRLEQALAELDVAQSDIALTRSRLQYQQLPDTEQGVELRAPVSGTVLTSTVMPGSFVAQGEELFKIVDSEARWLTVQVPERFAARATDIYGVWLQQQDTVVTLTPEEGSQVIQGITAIDPLTRTATVILGFDAMPGLGMVGQRHAVNVISGMSRPMITVPASALINEDGRQVVYIQTGGETFMRRPVEVGTRDGAHISILAGVTEGDRVVSQGAYYIRLAAAGTSEIGHGHAH